MRLTSVESEPTVRFLGNIRNIVLVQGEVHGNGSGFDRDTSVDFVLSESG